MSTRKTIVRGDRSWSRDRWHALYENYRPGLKSADRYRYYKSECMGPFLPMHTFSIMTHSRSLDWIGSMRRQHVSGYSFERRMKDRHFVECLKEHLAWLSTLRQRELTEIGFHALK